MCSEEGEHILGGPDDDAYHQEEQGAEEYEDDNADAGLLVDGVDDFLVAFHEAADEGHVLAVGTVEDVEDVTDVEGYHAEDDVAQGVVHDGQRQGEGAHADGGEKDVADGEDGSNGIADASGDGKAEGSVEIVAVHDVGYLLEPLVRLAVFESLARFNSFLFVHFRLFNGTLLQINDNYLKIPNLFCIFAKRN